MSLFSRIKSSVIDWATGNSVSYSMEEDAYKEIMNLINTLEEELDGVIEKGTLADDWAIIDFQNNMYTLPLLKTLINETMKKNANRSMDEMNKLLTYMAQLQEVYDKYTNIIKIRIIRNATEYPEFQEIYYTLIELRKVLLSHMNLEPIKECGFYEEEFLPKYKQILKLKIGIAQRRTIILPYLSEMDYNKGR